MHRWFRSLYWLLRRLFGRWLTMLIIPYTALSIWDLAQGQELMVGPLDNWTLHKIAELNLDWYFWAIGGLVLVILITLDGARRIVDGPYLEDAVQIAAGKPRDELYWDRGRPRNAGRTLTIRCTARQREIDGCQVQLEELAFKAPGVSDDEPWQLWQAFNSIRLAWSFNDKPDDAGDMRLPKGVPKYCDLVIYEHHTNVEPHERKAKLVTLQEDQRSLEANAIRYAQYRARCALSARGDYEPARVDIYFEFIPCANGSDEWRLQFIKPEIQAVRTDGWWARSHTRRPVREELPEAR